ncbi:low molecular weight protein-tyrosine-phosphatase [Burkholderia sp. PU8-34]
MCVGNICRSPMAEGLLRHRIKGAQISSAGLDAMIGHGPDPHALALMNDRGIDISGHRARQLVEQISRDADLILVMEGDHRRAIERQYPYARGRVFPIGHFSGAEVADPYRQSRSAFEESLKLIEQGVEEWVQRIQKLN